MEFEDCGGCKSCEPAYDEQNSTICSYETPKEGEDYPNIKDLKGCPKAKDEDSTLWVKEMEETYKRMLLGYQKRAIKSYNRQIWMCSVFAILTGFCASMPITLPGYMDCSSLPEYLLKIGAACFCLFACGLNARNCLHAWNQKKVLMQSILEAEKSKKENVSTEE